MVRSYVLTDRERKIIQIYLDQGLKLEGYRELKHSITHLDLSLLDDDMQLIRRFLKEAG